MSEISYEVLEPYWTEWKRSSRDREDAEEHRRLAVMKNIFLSVAGHACELVDQDALAFVQSRLSDWRARLAGPNGTALLFRGLVDLEAIDARTKSYVLPTNVPVSFSSSESAALGFASRGHIEGVLISAEIPVSSIVFSDEEGFYREGGAHLETEVVVVLSEPIPCHVAKELVQPRTPRLLNRTAKKLWDEEAKRFRAMERAAKDGVLGQCGSRDV